MHFDHERMYLRNLEIYPVFLGALPLKTKAEKQNRTYELSIYIPRKTNKTE